MTVSLGLPQVGPPAGAQPSFGRGCNCRECSFYSGEDINPAVRASAGWSPLCSGTNASCSYCGCARSGGGAGGAEVAGGCGNCSVLCPSRTDISAWIADMGGTLDFDDIDLSVGATVSLPRFIPQVDGSNVDAFDAALRWPAYSVSLRRVMSEDSFAVYPKFAGKPAHEALKLQPGQLACLSMTGRDPLVERFYTRRVADRLWEQVAAMGWDFVISPNFSMYGNWSRTAMLASFRRSLVVAQEAADLGLAVAPNLYWYRLEDLRRYVRWAEDTSPAYLAVNLQTFRTDSDWRDMALPGLTFLAMTMPTSTTWVFQGTSRFARIRDLQQLFGDRMVLIAQKAFQAAQHGEVMTARGPDAVHARAADAFTESVRFYSSLFGSADAGRMPAAGDPAVLPGSAGDPTARWALENDADVLAALDDESVEAEAGPVAEGADAAEDSQT